MKEIKTLREDAQLAVGKLLLCRPLARKESRNARFFVLFVSLSGFTYG